MATKYDAILLYSDDIWNNDREQDFTQAKVIGKGKASESECETFFPCGLYYEKGTTDDLGYQCLSITAEDVDVQGTKMTVISVALRNAAGQKMTLQLPKDSRKFPVQFGGVTGNAVTFYIDGAETYRNSKGAKEKAKKFIEARIEKLRSCDSPFAAESMEMGMEEMASEFSVERINPTPVAGKADMKAESFGAEENLAVADVDIHDGMNIPAGTGSIIGQAVPETDFTPFGASAEGGIGEDEVDANIIIDKLNIVDDEGLVEVGNYFGISNDDSEELYDEILKAIKNSPSSYLTQLQVILDDEYEAESFGECPKCGKSDLVIQYYEGKGDFGCGMCGHQWFEDFGAEAFGGDLASLYDYNGIESVRVEAPLGHGVTENLGAEEMDAYGGLMGVAAAFAAGLAYRHWSKSKINGDDAPDSETPAEESDDAPQA